MSSPPTYTQEEVEDVAYNRDEEYLAAQRAAVEAVMVGRETLETAARQGEQLQNAETMAEETEYKLDRASRTLRGMTWSGWLANKFSRDVEPPTLHPIRGEPAVRVPPKVYDDIPTSCREAAQAVQNYHANLQVLETCETDEQKETCLLICDNMYMEAKREVTKLHRSAPEDARDVPELLGKDLEILSQRQKKEVSPAFEKTAGKSEDKSFLFKDVEDAPSAGSLLNNLQMKQQEDHLDTMAKHLTELGSLATTLNTSLVGQTETLENLDGKSDSMLFKTKMVTRRADRMIQKRSWTRPKSEFLYNASIRHIATGKYLAVDTNNGVRLSDKLNETCIFGVWQRQAGAQVFGLQSKYSRRWMGQNLLGNLVCSAYKFDRREEWDTDSPDWKNTPLLCASAGWGNGGYLLIGKDDHVVSIGGGGLLDKKNADIFSFDADPLWNKKEDLPST